MYEVLASSGIAVHLGVQCVFWSRNPVMGFVKPWEPPPQKIMGRFRGWVPCNLFWDSLHSLHGERDLCCSFVSACFAIAISLEGYQYKLIDPLSSKSS